MKYLDIPISDSHIHLDWNMPLENRIKLLEKIIEKNNYDTVTICPVPFVHDRITGCRDFTVNLCAMYAKCKFTEKVYAFAGLSHHCDEKLNTKEFYLEQVKFFMETGYGGIKMLEARTGEHKAYNCGIDDEKYDVIVIGGGAAGMIAAGRAGELGKNVLLIEKNEKLGKKVYITGKGRCNVTNSADLDDMIKAIPINGRFMYSALSKFSNWDLIGLLYENGTPTKEERGGRMFPESDKSSDIIKALSKYALLGNVKLLRDEVTEILTENNEIKGVKLKSGGEVYSSKVILATGGKSYPQTGSTGDGYKFARMTGHTVVKPKAALVPLVTAEKWVSELQGLSLKNISIEITENEKTIYEDFGEMLFTHFGLSGPVILSSSIHMENFKDNKYKVKIDLKPALDMETLDKRLLKDFEETKNKDYANSLDSLLPKKLIPVIIRVSQINPRKKVNEITKEERLRLCALLKSFEFNITGFRPIEEAIITSGGVSVSEINPKTMESKIVKGLFFAGEIIDVCAYTGGYNLQIAFSTGYCAGDAE